MAQLAPWLRPTDVLGAAQGGAAVGLQRRGLDQSYQAQQDNLGLENKRFGLATDQFGLQKQQFAQQQLMDSQNTMFKAAALNQSQQSAADQLQLQYDQLWEQHQRAQDQAELQQMETAAKYAQASAALALQAGHYDDANALQENAQALTASHYSALEEAAKRQETFNEQLATDKLALMKKNAEDTLAYKNDNANAKYTLQYDNANTGDATDIFGSPKLKDINDQIKVQAQIARSQNADPSIKEQAGAQLQTLLALRSQLTSIPLPQQQVTTNQPTGFSALFNGPILTTNTVPGVIPSPAEGTVPQPTQGPQVDVELQRALRAIQMGAPVSAVKARYRDKTGKDLQ